MDNDEQVRALSRDRIVDVAGLVGDATLLDRPRGHHLALGVDRDQDAERPTGGADSTPSTPGLSAAQGDSDGS